MSELKNEADRDLVTRLSMIIGIIGSFVVAVVWKGVFRKSTWTNRAILVWMIYPPYISLFVFSKSWDIPRLLDTLSWIFPSGLGAWVYFHIPVKSQFILVTIVPFLTWLAILGAWSMIKIHRYQKAMGHLGLKTPTGLKPQVIDVISTTPGQKKIILKAVGFDVADVRSKKVVLESSLNLFVQSIRVSEGNRQIIEILVSDRELPTLIPFDDVSDQLTEPFSFLIGEGVSGFLVSNLQKVHHLLVAGASGGGKSFFVKQLLIGLLRSSKHIQLYLLDLKKGVEVKVFEKLENVLIAKETLSAIEILDAIVKEMERRFVYLEDKGYTEIDCQRDKLDRIVVLVDEASELFTVVKSSKAIKASAECARDLADKIAKLGRVAGIHLILATQKVVKETIDTRVQTNINARMVFRLNTSAASVTVLGNKLASDLPEIGGRGIWSVGSRDLVVQTPKLGNEEVAKKVAILTEKFNGEKSPLLQQMLICKHKKPGQNQISAIQTVKEDIDVDEEAF